MRIDSLAVAAKGNAGGTLKIEPVAATPTRPQHAMGEGIGEVLRRARTDRGLSLADLQARTKIRAKYLAALEDERFEDLPPLPFARGFLQTIAKELDLDVGPLARRLQTAMAKSPAPPAVLGRLDGAVTPAVPPSRLRRLAVTAAIAVLVVGGALAVYFAQQLRRLGEPAAPPAPPVVSLPAEEPSAGPQATPATAAVEPPAAPPRSETAGPPADGGVTVELAASGRSWILVLADDRRVFEGFVDAGEVRRWEARTTIRLRVGNAGAVSVLANDQRLGVLGRPGEVVDRTFSRDSLH